MYKTSKPDASQLRGGRGAFGDLRESRELLGSEMRGKSVVFVVDDRDFGPESRILQIGVFAPIGAAEGSKVLKYSEFFSSPAVRADALILRSSRLFAVRLSELERSIVEFRRQNPESAVILCVFEMPPKGAIIGLHERGAIDVIDENPPNDFELLRACASILAGRSSE